MPASSRGAALAACLLVAAVAAPAPVRAQAGPPPVSVEQPWARPTLPRQQVGAAYMRLTSPAGDRLLGATSPVAGRAELHETRMDGDVMRMREVPALELPAGQAVALAPGGLHLMLMGLREPLTPGQRFPVVLQFERAGAVSVEVAVGAPERAPASAAAPAGHGR